MNFRNQVAALMRELPSLNPETIMTRVADLEAKGAVIHFEEYVKIIQRLYHCDTRIATEIVVRDLAGGLSMEFH